MNPELARRIAFTLGALLVYRLSLHIPIPGISPAVWDMLRSRNAGLSGLAGGTRSVPVAIIGLTPYISAAIIVQVIWMMFSRVRALAASGEAGRRRMLRLTLGLTMLLATIQAFGIASGLEGLVADRDGSSIFVAAVSILAGTCFVIWLSELITRHGVGNGIALLLTVNIVAALPPNVAMTIELSRQGALSGNLLLCEALLSVLIVASMVFVESARRRIPLAFAPQTRPAALSLKLNSAGLIPVVMAPWVFSVPIFFIGIFGLNGLALAALGQFPHLNHTVLNAIVVFFLALIYASFVLDPEQSANSLGKLGGAIPGIDPGEPTATCLDSAMSHTALFGAAYLAVQILLWDVWVAYGNGIHSFGGTAELIVVCTILDIRKQVGDMSLAKGGSLRGNLK